MSAQPFRHADLDVHSWTDYELIDSGGDRKLERYGEFVVIRPETQALWQPLRPEEWKKAHAEFRWADGKGAWKKKAIPETWTLAWRDARFNIRLTSFKHTGVFPEQAANWEWIAAHTTELCSAPGETPRVLNLFGYTGIASIVAAQAGAKVIHVDASKQSNVWAKKNAEQSGLPEGDIRFILEDALKFVERDARRAAIYEGIIVDPPAFGRGPKGEVWRIEESLPRLLAALKPLLAPHGFFVLNGYAAGYSPQSFLQAVEGVFGGAYSAGIRDGEFGELRICESASDRYVPSGIYVRFVR